MNNYFTKTGFRSGLICHKKLWLDISKSVEKKTGFGAALRLARGKEVDAAALKSRDISEVIRVVNAQAASIATAEALKACAAFGQATFLHENLSARLDIIEKDDNNTWNIFEVKMSGELKEEHIPDVAFQKYVAEKAGISIKDCFILHLNKQCIAPDFSNLFTCENVSDKVAAYLEEFPSILETLLPIIDSSTCPDVRINRHCKNPYLCDYKYHCWEDLSFHSVFTISGLRQNKLDQLLDQSIWEVVNVPDSFELSALQQKYTEVVKSGEPYISRPAIKAALSELSYPIYFLDFEADRPPIPWINGMSPYELLPFQFCVHKLEHDSAQNCFEYLHLDKTDPRRELATKLCEAIGSDGSVVTFTTAMENPCLDALIKACPEYAKELTSIKERIWDQSKIFKNHFLHPSFGGQYSLKAVLPVIVPSLSYNAGDIQDGEAAVYKWIKMIASSNAVERNEIETNLKSYCKIDSLGTLEIYKYIDKL